jgi:rhodanese-related sulfurtransferase
MIWAYALQQNEMKKPSELVELFANIATIFVFIFLVAFLAHRYLMPHEKTPKNEKLRQGTQLSLPGIDWTDAHSTLILALSVECRYCRASSEFYRRLLALNAAKRFRPVAVFPQPEKAGQAYLQSEGLAVSEVLQANLLSLGVDATPTLILADEVGRISSSWTGQLTPEGEKDVIARLGLEQADKTPPNDKGIVIYNNKPDSSKLIPASEFVRMTRIGEDLPLIDIRSREEYASGHITGTLNIPMDELEARASHEVPKDKIVLIYCHYCASCEGRASEEGVQTFCSLGIDMLRDLGFTQVRYVSDDLYTLKQAGIKISTLPSPVSRSQ